MHRDECTTNPSFWGEKGLFNAQYAEERRFIFPLRTIIDGVGRKKLFKCLKSEAYDWEEMEE